MNSRGTRSSAAITTISIDVSRSRASGIAIRTKCDSAAAGRDRTDNVAPAATHGSARFDRSANTTVTRVAAPMISAGNSERDRRAVRGWRRIPLRIGNAQVPRQAQRRLIRRDGARRPCHEGADLRRKDRPHPRIDERRDGDHDDRRGEARRCQRASTASARSTGERSRGRSS